MQYPGRFRWLLVMLANNHTTHHASALVCAHVRGNSSRMLAVAFIACFECVQQTTRGATTFPHAQNSVPRGEWGIGLSTKNRTKNPTKNKRK
jgi:hypothetical protein